MFWARKMPVVRPGEARRAPVVLHAARGAEHVGHHQRQQQGRMQRAARGADVVDRGTVGLLHQQGRQQHRHGDEERAHTPPAASGSALARNAARGSAAVSRRHTTKARQQIDAEQRHLVAPQHHAGGDDPGGNAVEDRAPCQRPVQAQHRHGQIGEAQHLADVLDAPGHRGPVAEGQRGDQPAGPMPAPVAEPQHESRAGEEHAGQHGGVHRPQAGGAVDQRQRQERRGEDHRLRVGDLRMAAEHIGRPGRRVAARQALRQELDLRQEVRLGIPGDGHAAGQPGPADDQRGEGEEGHRERDRMRRGGRQISCQSRRMASVCGPARGAPRWSLGHHAPGRLASSSRPGFELPASLRPYSAALGRRAGALSFGGAAARGECHVAPESAMRFPSAQP